MSPWVKRVEMCYTVTITEYEASANYRTNDTKQNDANTAVSRHHKHKEDIAQYLYRVQVKYRPLCQNTS